MRVPGLSQQSCSERLYLRRSKLRNNRKLQGFTKPLMSIPTLNETILSVKFFLFLLMNILATFS